MSKTKEELEVEQKKAEEEAAKKKAEEAKLSEEDKKIAELMKDPDAVSNLLAAKRAANEEAKKLRLKLEEYEKAQKAADEKVLQEQGKFKELAEKAKTDADTQRTAFKAQRVDFELRLEAVKAGAIDPEDAVKLCDKTKIVVSDDFSTVTEAKEAIEALKAAKPHLFEKKEGVAPPPGEKPSLRGQGKEEGLTPLQKIEKGLMKK